MRNILTALIISVSTVLSIVGVCMVFRHFQRKRALARMIALVCPPCGKIYGADMLRTMKEAGYFWNPAPGYSVISLRLPSSTFLVTCPHCSAEAEFTPNGRIFKCPEEGVRSFTRFVRA